MEDLNFTNITNSTKVQEFVGIYNQNNNDLIEYIKALESRIKTLEDQKLTILRANAQLIKLDNKYQNMFTKINEMSNVFESVKEIQKKQRYLDETTD